VALSLLLMGRVLYAVNREAMAAVMSEAIRRFIQNSIPGGAKASAEEVDSVIRLCLLGVHRTGAEDPRALAKAVSDPLLEHLVKNVRKTREVPAMAKASQFFVIEWCHRNGHLEEDWKWEWEGADGGRILYRSRIPLESIAMPTG
jgi:hypothetical protein